MSDSSSFIEFLFSLSFSSCLNWLSHSGIFVKFFELRSRKVVCRDTFGGGIFISEMEQVEVEEHGLFFFLFVRSRVF